MGMFGLSPEETQVQQQQANQENAYALSKLDNNQVSNYYGSLAGQRIGDSITSAFGVEDPAMVKAKKLQIIQQQTEQDAPFQADPEKHMLLGIKNLLGAGFNNEAESGYKHYLDFAKQNTSNMNAQSMAANTQINVDKQADSRNADNEFNTLLPTLNQPVAPSNEQSRFTQDKDKTQQEINTIPDDAQRAKVQAAFDAQYSFQPKYSEDSINQLNKNGGPRAMATAKHYEAVNEQDQKMWDRTNNVSASTQATIDAAAERQQAKLDSKSSASSGLTDDALTNAAISFLTTGVMPSLGNGNAPIKIKILNKAAELAISNGDSAQATTIRTIANKANVTALAQLSKQQVLVSAFEKTANSNADLALGLSDKVDRLGVPVFDTWIQSGQKSVAGNEMVSRFNAANETFVNEYAKIMSGSMGNTPVSDAARAHAHGILQTAMTKAQYKGVMSTLKQEMQNRMDGFNNERQGLLDSFKMKNNNPPSSNTEPSLQESVSKSGKPIVMRNGQWEYK